MDKRNDSKRKLTAALLGIFFAVTLTSVRYVTLDSVADIFNLVEIVESAEFLEISLEEDHKIMSSEYVNFPLFVAAKAHTPQLIGNTTTVSFVPDIPPEQS